MITSYLRTTLSSMLARPYPIAMMANMVACDYLRKMGQMERPVLLAELRNEFPTIAAEVERVYPHHCN